MPYPIPTLAEARALSRDGVIEALKVDRIPGNSPAGILADGNGALAFLVFQYLQRMALEFLPDQAGEEMLLRWADIFLPEGREAATYAVLAATLSGSDGIVIPQATQFVAAGLYFQTLSAVTLGGSDVSTPISVRALTAGTVGNLDPGIDLSLVAAISGVTSSATVTGTITNGVDVESVESLRDRVLARIRKPPMGGDADDYVAWAREVPGVTRAWCSPNEMGPGTVTVRFMMDDLRAENGGFPTADDVAAVRAHVDSVRPVAVRDCFVVAPVPIPVSFGVAGLSVDTPATRAAITASVAAMLRDRAAPASAINGIRVEAQTIYAAWVSEAVLGASGVGFFDLVMADQPMPHSGGLAVPGTITFT